MDKNNNINKKLMKIFFWVRKNLFYSCVSTALTFLLLYIIYIVLANFINWAIINANFIGSSRDECTGTGACWLFITNRINILMYGFYPENALWRPNLAIILVILFIIPLFLKIPYKLWIVLFDITILPIIIYFIIHGDIFNLDLVATNEWGGLMLTLVLSIVSIIISFPLGILLALGRRSENMPIVRMISTIYIEFIRGVPLITILFFASVMLPLLLDSGSNLDKLLRAIVAITLFQAAYIAEAVRGGLQTISKGQYEAADSLGLNYFNKTRLVILPQALKISIPGIVNSIIEIFKDTSLVAIIGLSDLLGIMKASNSDPQWLGYAKEGYLFVALVYFIFCYSMSKYSMHIEKKLSISR